MAKLKERIIDKRFNKYCYVVDELITLEELGFKEDGYHNWVYIIYQCDSFSKSLIASGDYLHLRDQTGNKYTDVSLCTLWNKDIAGTIKKREIEDFINMLKQGNVKKKESN